jgi:hypothetical protein
MDVLNHDVQIIICSFLSPAEIRTLYESDMIHNVCHHVGFIVQCTTVIPNELVEWFQEKQIKLHLLKECRISSGREMWLVNGKLHRDDDLPAYKSYYAFIRNYGINQSVVIHSKYHVYFRNGVKHRDNNLPAVIFFYDVSEWWVNGEFQRREYFPSIVDDETLRLNNLIL